MTCLPHRGGYIFLLKLPNLPSALQAEAEGFTYENLKVFIPMSGSYGGLKAKRLEVFGRLELLQVINDGAPYWLIRLRDSRAYDAKYWQGKDSTLCWRFTSLSRAKTKFRQLCAHPEYVLDAAKWQKFRDSARQRALARVTEQGDQAFASKSGQK